MRRTAIFLMICLLVTSGGTWEKGAESGACALVSEQLGEERDGTLTIGVGVSGAPGGICALMAVMTLPPGWTVQSVQKADGAGNLTMTVRVNKVKDRVKDRVKDPVLDPNPDGCRVFLLFDGAQPAPGGGTLALVTVCRPEKDGADAETEPVVRTEAAVLNGESVPLYYMKETGETDTIPLASCELILTTSHTADSDRASDGQGREAVSEPPPAADDETQPMPETPPAPDAETDPAGEAYGWTVIGCCEAVSPDGTHMDVRLLFTAADGAGKGTPAAFPICCPPGHEPVRLSVGAAENMPGVCAVTFSGLPCTGVVHIAGMTRKEQGTALFLVFYENGHFDGWLTKNDGFE